ncbi:MAG: hypothetical protein FWD94_05580 [Treponema sp.]|nr:hypothetical protein [Treponema sp.]
MSDVASTLKSAEHFKGAVERLYSCTTREQISSVFSRYDINDLVDKRELLYQCMDIESYFDVPHEELSAEDEYDYTVSVFIEGSWRLLANG